MESIALKAAAVVPSLLLQRPSCRSKCKDFVTHLNCHLELWKEGNIFALLDEGRCIQRHLRKISVKNDDAAIARRFSTCVLQGNIKGALRCLSYSGTGGVLCLDDVVASSGERCTVRDVLLEKHPSGQPDITVRYPYSYKLNYF